MHPYSEDVKPDESSRLNPPHRQSVDRIAEELGIHFATRYNWREAWRLPKKLWTTRLQVLLESHTCSNSMLSAQ